MDDPLASKLVFSLGNDTTNDGFLNTYEIYNLDLNAQLAVLSACKTGTGKLSQGEGIMSLARGFLYAGVPGIIMTLWAVEDISGSEVISGFYYNLYNGEDKDIALQNSKLDYLAKANPLFKHPYFWAAYVQIGDSRPLELGSDNKYVYYVLGGIALVVIIFIAYRKNRRKPVNG